MSDEKTGVVHIDFPDGPAWNGKVTLDGVMIPVSRVTLTADAESGVAQATLVVPNVCLDAKVRDVLVEVVDVEAPDNSPEAVVERYRAAGGLGRAD